MYFFLGCDESELARARAPRKGKKKTVSRHHGKRSEITPLTHVGDSVCGIATTLDVKLIGILLGRQDPKTAPCPRYVCLRRLHDGMVRKKVTVLHAFCCSIRAGTRKGSELGFLPRTGSGTPDSWVYSRYSTEL